MKTKAYKTLFLFALFTIVSLSSLHAGVVEILGINFNNMGMNKRMVRMGANYIFLDVSSIHLEGVVKLKTTGYSDKRLVVAVIPLDDQGQELEDNLGLCHNLTGVNVARDGQTINVPIVVPYQWITLENQQRTSLAFNVIVLNSEGQTITEKMVNVTPQNININRENSESNMLLGLLGGGGSSDVDFGNILGGLLGSPSATSEQLCSACDGMGICPECYGDAFFKPSVCRRCTNDPGICRRCKGTKTEKVNIELYGY